MDTEPERFDKRVIIEEGEEMEGGDGKEGAESKCWKGHVVSDDQWYG